MIAKIVTGASFGGCTAYAYGKDQAEVIAHDGIIPDDPFNAIVNPPSAQSITEVRIFANGSLSSLQFAKGLSAGISGNEDLSFIASI